MRYLLKKTSGQVFFVPIKGDATYLNPTELSQLAKDVNIRANACKTFTEAFELAKKVVDERQGLLCVSGHSSLIVEYWKEKGIKRF